jgi:hypothetical protein
VSAADIRNAVQRAWRRATGGNALEVCLLGAAALAVVATSVATVRAGFAEAYRDDLAFRGAIDETSALIENQGPQGVATYQRGTIEVGGEIIPVDSLAVSGDSLLIGSLAKGGFLRDQIDAFNDHAARRAVSAAGAGRESAGALAPSLFHLARSDSGYHFLSSSLNGYALLVPSPFAEGAWSTVRTTDWSTGPALVGLLDNAHLTGSDSALSSASLLNAVPCRVKGQGPLTRLVYCRSAAGADIGEAYDLGFELGRGGSFDAGAGLRVARRSPLWWNGSRATAPATVRAGDLLFTDPMGAAALSDLQRGILAGQQWLNGRNAFTTARGSTLQLFGRAGRSAPGTGPLTLGLDATLSQAIDARVDDFMTRHEAYLDAVSIVVADVRTGEVRAVSESRPREGQPLRAFEPVLLGSMVKPILAAAVLSQDPSLADLSVQWGGPEISEVAGVGLRVPFRNPLNGCGETIDFEGFLRCSSNQYAVELLVRSLQRSAGRTEIAPDGRIPNELLEHTALTNGLLALYDDADVVSVRAPGRSDRLWRGSANAPARVPTDRTLHPWASRPWFIHPESPGTPVDWLARFAFGGWENRWTLLGAAEAYARIATGREVHLSMHDLPSSDSTFARVDAPAAGAFRRVRGALAQVGESGTARGLTDALETIGPATDSLHVFAKTGTLNEITSRLRDDDVFIKSLAVVVGRPTDPGPSAELACGLVIVSYFEFRQDWRRAVGTTDEAALPDLHRAFNVEELGPALRDSWKRMATCPDRP